MAGNIWGRCVALAASGAALVLLWATSAPAQLISNVTLSGTNPRAMTWTGQLFAHPNLGFTLVVPALNEDVPAYTDRTHQWNGASTVESLAFLGLVGAEYIMPANDARSVPDYRLDVTVAQSVDVYVFWDRRGAPQPWLAAQGFQDTGWIIGVDEGGDATGPGGSIQNTSSIFMKQNVPAGMFSTFEYNRGGHNMYGVAVKPAGSGIAEPPMRPEWPLPNFALVDIGATGGRLEFGSSLDSLGAGQIGAGVINTNNTNLAPQTINAFTGDQFTVAIDNLDRSGNPSIRPNDQTAHGLDWRDRGDNPLGSDTFRHPLIRMGEDLVKNNAGIVRVTLGNLPAGTYEVTSFHLDPSFSQADNIQVLVDVGDGRGWVDTEARASARIENPDGTLRDPGGVGYLTTAAMLQHSTTFRFTADGTNSVRVLFDGQTPLITPADYEVPLNGLAISRISSALRGDANGDGKVTRQDAVIMLRNYGMPADATTAEGDFNADGLVGLSDLWILQKTLDAPAAAPAAAVPEPSSAILLAAGALGWLTLRRRRVDCAPSRP